MNHVPLIRNSSNFALRYEQQIMAADRQEKALTVFSSAFQDLHKILAAKAPIDEHDASVINILILKMTSLLSTHAIMKLLINSHPSDPNLFLYDLSNIITYSPTVFSFSVSNLYDTIMSWGTPQHQFQLVSSDCLTIFLKTVDVTADPSDQVEICVSTLRTISRSCDILSDPILSEIRNNNDISDPEVFQILLSNVLLNCSTFLSSVFKLIPTINDPSFVRWLMTVLQQIISLSHNDIKLIQVLDTTDAWQSLIALLSSTTDEMTLWEFVSRITYPEFSNNWAASFTERPTTIPYQLLDSGFGDLIQQLFFVEQSEYHGEQTRIISFELGCQL